MTLARNSFLSVSQTIIGMVVLLVVYRRVAIDLGLAALGVWAVLSAVSASGRLADLGMSRSLVRMLPSELQSGRLSVARAVTIAALLLLTASLALLLPLLYLLLSKLLPSFVGADASSEVIRLLPAGLVILFWNSIGACVSGGLEGAQRYDLRAYAAISGSAVLAVSAWFLVPRFGLEGLVAAHLIQGFIHAILAAYFLGSVLQVSKFVFRDLDISRFPKLIRVGGALQVITLSNLAFDPLSRVLMARYGGLETAGLFDVVTKLVVYVRSLVISGLQVMAPYFASGGASDVSGRSRVYRTVFSLICAISAVVYSGVLVSLPAASWTLIGYVSEELLWLGAIVMLGWLGNTISAPAFFALLGAGRLRWSIWSQLTLAASNAILALLLGRLFNGVGVAIAMMVALLVSGAVTIAGQMYEAGYALTPVKRRDRIFALAGLCVILAWFALPAVRSSLAWATLMLAVVACLALGLIAAHPVLRSRASGVVSADPRG